jgi:hypothetical protein
MLMYNFADPERSSTRVRRVDYEGNGMGGQAQTVRGMICLCGALFALGGCGSSSSSAAKVGDCIDAGKQVVDCGSSTAKQKLVSDQSASNAMACVAIGDNPQVEVKVGDGTFCAEPK